jgi:hypothetical protein
MSNREIIDIQINSKDEALLELQKKIDKLNDSLNKISNKQFKTLANIDKDNLKITLLQKQISSLNEELFKLSKHSLNLKKDSIEAVNKEMISLNKEMQSIGKQKKIINIGDENSKEISKINILLQEMKLKLKTTREKMDELPTASPKLKIMENNLDKINLKLKDLEQRKVNIEIDKKNNLKEAEINLEKLKTRWQELLAKKENIKFGIDPEFKLKSEELKKQIDSLNLKIQTLNQKKVDISIDNKNSKNIEIYGKELTETTNKISQLQMQQSNLNKTFSLTANAWNSVSGASQITKNSLDKMSDSLKEMSSNFKITRTLSSNITGLTKTLVDSSTATKLTASNFEKMGDILNNINNSTKKYNASVDEMAITTKKFTTSVTKLTTSEMLDWTNNTANALNSLSPMVSVLEGIGKAMTGLAASAIKEAQEWEMLRIKLGTFYSSVSEATEEFNYLVKMAKTTPFEIKGLVQSAVMLRAFGHDMRSTIQLTGDLAAALGGDVKDASYAVSRALSGASMGFLMLQRTWGISYAKLKALGAEFMTGNRLIAGSIKTQKALLMALQEHIGAMERQSATAAGRLSNLKDAIDTLKESVGQAVLPAIKQGVDIATGLVNMLTNIPQEIKIMAVGIAGLTGGLLLLVSAGYKAVNTLIALRLSMLEFQTSVGGQTLIKQISHLALLPIALTNIKTTSNAAGTALKTMTTSGIAGIAGLISSVSVLSAFLISIPALIAAGVGVAWYLEVKKTQKVLAEVTEETGLLRDGLVELRNEYPNTFSLTKIFNEELKKTAEQLADNTDKAYKYKGSIKGLYAEDEEAFIENNTKMIEAEKSRLEVWKINKQKNLEERKQIEEKYGAEMTEEGTVWNVTPPKETLEYWEYLTEQASWYTNQIRKQTEMIEQQSETYTKALELRQKYGGAFDELLLKWDKAKTMEDIDPVNIVAQKEAIEEMLKFEQLQEEDRITLYKERQTVITKINKLTLADIDKMEAESLKQYAERSQFEVKIGRQTAGEKLQIHKDYNKLRNEVSESDKGLEEEWKKYLQTQKNALKTSEITEKEYLEKMRGFQEEHADQLSHLPNLNMKITNEIATHSAKAMKEMDKAVKESNKATKEAWKLFLIEQKTALANSEITEEDYVANMKAYQEEHAKDLEKLPELNATITYEIAKNSEKSVKQIWDNFSDSQQIALDKGSISHKQYIANLKQYLVDHQNELLTDADTRVAIEKEIASEEEKLHEELVNDKIKMDDDYISAKFGAEEAAYVKAVANLNKQREDYIKHGNDKIDVDRWYYAQKEQLDYEYYIKQKQNMLKFQEDLAKSQTRKGSFAEERASADADMDKQLLDLEILAKEYEKQNFKKADIDRMVSGERLRIETEHAEKMQDILMKEQQFYEEMYREVLQHYLDMGQLTEAEYLRMQQSILEESVKRHEEAAKVIEKNILAGGEISQQEAEIYKIYTKETKELREINKQLDTRLDSTGKIFETEMDILKQELELKKLRGEISDDKAELTILKYRKDFLDTHKQEFELIKQKRITQGELTADEQEFYKTYQGLLIEQEQGLDTLQKTVSTTDKLTTSTQKATTAAKDLGTSMEKVADSTGKAAEEMKSYGSMMENLGPTLTPDQALGNLPGATSPVSAPTISGRYTTPDYSVNQLRGGARAGGEWDTFFKDMYTELGEQTKTENRRNFEEEMEEKRNHWKREFEAVDLNVRGMNDSTSAAMDSMSADINRFSNTPVNVTVNVETTGGGGGGEGPAGGGALSTPEGQVTDGGEGTTGGGHEGGHTVGADYSSINTSGVGAQSGWSGAGIRDNVVAIAAGEGAVIYDTSQNLTEARKRPVGGDINIAPAFDNPSNDAIAKKLGEKQTQSVLSVIQKNTEDIVKNFLAGTVSAVKQSYNNITNNSKAETRNYYNNKKSLSSAYNISIDNASPVKRVPMRVRNGIEGITDFALKSRFSGGRL